MESEARELGIGVLGAVPWGTHICHFYHTKQDLIDILVPYFQAGLENNESCVWITSKPLSAREAKAALGQAVPNFSQYLASKQMEIIPHTRWYLKGGTYNRKRVLNDWVDKLEQALASGYDGLRVTGDTAWLDRKDWHEFISYEEEVNNAIGKHKMLAICTYPLHKYGASQVIDVMKNHQYNLIKHKDELVLIGSPERKQPIKINEAIVETALDGFWVNDLEGRFIEVNDSYCQMTGYTREEMLQMSIQDIEAVETPEETIRHINQIVKQGTDHFETLHRCKDGRIIDVEVNASYSDVGKGQLFVFIRDVTERKQAEEALMESEEKYRAVFERSSDSIVLMDMEDAIVDFNEKAYQNLGYSREEFARLKLSDIEAVESDEEIKEHLEEISSGGKAIFETKHRTKDGGMRDVVVSVRPLHTGDKSFVLNIWRYITERQQMDELLLASEQRYRHLFQSIGEAVVVLGEDGRYLDCNEAAFKMLGYSREEFLNLTLDDIVHQDYRPPPEHKQRHALSIEPIRLESAHCTKDGRVIPVEVYACSIEYQGEPAILVTARDITERRQAEEAQRMLSQSVSGRHLTQLTHLQEGFTREGFKGLADQEIIELLLSLVLPARKSKHLAEACIKRFQNLRDFLAASPQELQKVGITPACMFCIKLLHELPTEVLKHNIMERSVYKSSQEVFDYLYYSMRDLKIEVFKIIYLNSRSQIIDTSDLFIGTADYINVRPREIVESAIAHSAAGLIFVHNHPTGDPTPSKTDKQLTRDLVFVGEILQIKILDHIIIGENCYFSFADDGLIRKYEDNFLNLKIRGVLASIPLYQHYRQLPRGFHHQREAMPYTG